MAGHVTRRESLTSKPIEPTPSTLKADLAVFVNSNMQKIIGKNAHPVAVCLEYVGFKV